MEIENKDPCVENKLDIERKLEQWILDETSNNVQLKFQNDQQAVTSFGWIQKYMLRYDCVKRRSRISNKSCNFHDK
jgi:hypothetical protein